MAKINLLSKSVSELIAAGEVVERPASVVKETVENSIDAGSSHITVEIKRGGITFIRITDDGCGISKTDVPTAFLRHATSKIKTEQDLNRIETLGFRGEALAAIASVARVEMITKTADEECGTHYVTEGGEEKENVEIGCPPGTTLIVRDIFYNTPARMKFLKKDASEATAVAAIVERTALSHPEIAFKFIKDEKQIFATPGDGNLGNAIYSVLGREFHSGLIPVNANDNGVTVEGFTCKPVFCRASRSHQFIFLNGRLVLSRTVMAAAEQAYKECSMVGKFPGFVLLIKIAADTVDVNVHPAKTEVRFVDERKIFSAVFYAVKNAILSGDTRPDIAVNKPKQDNFFRMTAEQYRQTAVKLPEQPKTVKVQDIPVKNNAEEKPTGTVLREENTPFFMRNDYKKHIDLDIAVDTSDTQKPEKPQEEAVQPPKQEKAAPIKQEVEYNPENEVKFIGEAFNTYIIVSRGSEIYLIDKHAAHERIIYNRLKKTGATESQALLMPINIKLTEAEHSAIVSNIDLMEKAGFEIEDFGMGTVLVRAVPAALDKGDIEKVISEAAASLTVGAGVHIDTLDGIFHTVACKAAIKAGYITSKEELLSLAVKVLDDRDVFYCPHGRPVAFTLKKSELEKYFGRIQ